MPRRSSPEKPARGRPPRDPDLKTYEGRIGFRIRTLRQQRYKRIPDFVDALRMNGVNVKSNCISQWELGDRMPRITELWAIANTLGVTLNTLVPRG